MKLSKYHQDKIARHRQLWDWCFHNPEKEKNHWPEWKHNGGKLKEVGGDCFLCQITEGLEEYMNHTLCTDICPLFPAKIMRGGDKKGCLGGLYEKWRRAGRDGNMRTRRKYAKLIRDLPVRK